MKKERKEEEDNSAERLNVVRKKETEIEFGVSVPR